MDKTVTSLWMMMALSTLLLGLYMIAASQADSSHSGSAVLVAQLPN